MSFIILYIILCDGPKFLQWTKHITFKFPLFFFFSFMHFAAIYKGVKMLLPRHCKLRILAFSVWFDVPDGWMLVVLLGNLVLLTLDDSLLLSLHKDLIEWIVCNGMPQTLDPLVLLLLGRCRHAINSVLTLDNLKKRKVYFFTIRYSGHGTLRNFKNSVEKVAETHFALGIRLACFYDFSTTCSVEFEAVRLTFVGDFALANLEKVKEGRKSHQLYIRSLMLHYEKLTIIFSNGMMPRGSLSVVYSK